MISSSDTLVGRARSLIGKFATDSPTPDEVEDLLNTLWTLNDAGDIGRLMALSDAVLTVLQAEDHPEARAEFLNLHGQTLHEAKHLAQAGAVFEEMLRLGEALDDPQVIGSARFGLGSLEQSRGDSAGAREEYATAFRPLSKAGDYPSLLRILLNIAQIAIDAGSLDEAQELVASAGELAEQVPDQLLRASCNGLAGTLAAHHGDIDGALRLNRKSLRQARLAGSTKVALLAIQNLAATYSNAGNPRMARQWYEKGLVLAVSAPRRVPMLAGAAHAAGRLGDFEAALTYLGRLEAESQTADQHPYGTHVAVELGALAFGAGDLDAAERLVLLADPVLSDGWGEIARALAQLKLDIEDERGSLATFERVLAELLERVPEHDDTSAVFLLEVAGHALARRHQHERAAQLLRDALRRARTEDASGRAWMSAQAGAALLENGGGAEAAPFFANAARHYRRAKNQQLDFECSNDWANALTVAGEYGKALRLQRRCLRLGESLDDRAMIAQASYNLGVTLRRKGRAREALARLRRAGRLYQSLGDLSGQAAVQTMRGLAWLDRGRRSKAAAALKAGLDLAATADDDRQRAVALGGLASIARGQGKPAEARRLYEAALELELGHNDVGHAAESQAGLLRVLVELEEDELVETAVERLLELASKGRRMELASWALGVSGHRALADGKEIALELFGASLLASLLGEEEDEARLLAFAKTSVDVLSSLAGPAGAAGLLMERMNKVAAILTRHVGPEVGEQLAELLKSGAEIARQALTEKDEDTIETR